MCEELEQIQGFKKLIDEILRITKDTEITEEQNLKIPKLIEVGIKKII